MPPRPPLLEHSQSRYSCVKLVCLLKSILPSPFLAQNRNVLCISSYMSSPAFVYLGREPHKQLDWSDKYPQQFFFMSGEHWGINVTPSSGKMVTFTLSYPVAFFFPNHLVYDSEWYLWKWSNLSHAFMVICMHSVVYVSSTSYYCYKVK